MKYTKKMPSTDIELSKQLLSDGWKKIKEPSNITQAICFSLPFAFLGGAVVFLIAFWLSPSIFDFIKPKGFKISVKLDIITLVSIIGILGYMFLHEFAHAVFIPNVFQSDKTFWGFNGVFGFVFTTEIIKKRRFIMITIMPYFLLSIIMPFILNLFGLLNGYTVLLCLINAMGSCVDLMNLCLIVTQIPNGSNIMNNGFETFYK